MLPWWNSLVPFRPCQGLHPKHYKKWVMVLHSLKHCPKCKYAFWQADKHTYRRLAKRTILYMDVFEFVFFVVVCGSLSSLQETISISSCAFLFLRSFVVCIVVWFSPVVGEPSLMKKWRGVVVSWDIRAPCLSVVPLCTELRIILILQRLLDI